LDTGLAERCYQTDTAPEMAADSAYDRHWALTLLGQTMSRLQQEQASEGKAAEFAVLQQFLVADQSSYAEAAGRLGRNESAVRMAVHRLRKRYREIFREEISRTLADPAELDTEIRHLLAVLAA
jgi:RNA polymerase sigma-70 factor (ECF subfamily)